MQQQFVDRDGKCHTILALKRQQSEKAVLSKLSASNSYLNNFSSSSSGSVTGSPSKSSRSRKLNKRVTFEMKSLNSVTSIKNKSAAPKPKIHRGSRVRSYRELSKKYSRLKRQKTITVVKRHSNSFDVARSISLFCIVISTIVALFII
mmetsp:Transcript_22428/g.28670  ORF Transcript_22428/g.28670 Transcript_22428/m.28670 type:complete len:148 (-) Transcript_22428:1173-1616(-)